MASFTAVVTAPRLSVTRPEPGVRNWPSQSRQVSGLAAGSRIGHVPIYLFSTHGLHAPTAEDMRRGQGRNGNYEAHVETLRTIANLTGGRAIAAYNAPADVAPAVLEELTTYYALAYESTYPPDGRRR